MSIAATLADAPAPLVTTIELTSLNSKSIEYRDAFVNGAINGSDRVIIEFTPL